MDQKLDALSQRDSVSSISAEFNTEHTSDSIKKIAVFDFDGTVISGLLGTRSLRICFGPSSVLNSTHAQACVVGSSLQATFLKGRRGRELVVGALTQYSVEFNSVKCTIFTVRLLRGCIALRALEEVRRRQAE